MGVVAWGRVWVGSVAWVAVGVGMTEGRVVSSVIMPLGLVLTLAAQPQPVNRPRVSAAARVRLRIVFMVIPPVRMLTELVSRRDSGINWEFFCIVEIF